MFNDAHPMRWGRPAVVADPGHIDVSNASRIREQLRPQPPGHPHSSGQRGR